MYRTVRGEISKDSIGTTFIHEHLYVIPNDLPKYEDFTFDDIDRSIDEAIRFKNAGGQTIVDLTPINYGRNPQMLKKIAEIADINVMFVTGFHKEEFLPKWVEELTDDDIFEFLLYEINNGVSSAKLLPSAMKIGTSYNQVTALEERIIKICGRVQAATKIPMVTHCDKGTMGLEQLDLLKITGADLAKVCLSHVDLSNDLEYMKRICDTGASICFDHIGRDLINKDSQKIRTIVELIQDGYEDMICLSGDMGRKKYFKSYGGQPGLEYILTDFRTSLLDKIDEKTFNKMVKDNPQRILAW